jgi:exonuclease III
MSKVNKIAVATYNMSWASADGFDPNKTGIEQGYSSEPPLTEKNFLLSNPSTDRHHLWDNALNLLLNFLNYHEVNKIPCIVGLQELNIKPKSHMQNVRTIDDIERKLKDYQEKQWLSEYVVEKAEEGPAGAAIIYNKNVFGDVKYRYVCKGPFISKGRPLHMVFTRVGHLIVNAHFPHNNNNIPAFYNKVKCEIATFIQANTINQFRAIHFVGDLNIHDIRGSNKSSNIENPFRLNYYPGVIENEIKLEFKGSAPYSCCFMGTTFKDSFSKGYTKNGDLVYSTLPSISDIAIYPGYHGLGGRSIESDHELVYQIYENTGNSYTFKRK